MVLCDPTRVLMRALSPEQLPTSLLELSRSQLQCSWAAKKIQKTLVEIGHLFVLFWLKEMHDSIAFRALKKIFSVLHENNAIMPTNELKRNNQPLRRPGQPQHQAGHPISSRVTVGEQGPDTYVESAPVDPHLSGNEAGPARSRHQAGHRLGSSVIDLRLALSLEAVRAIAEGAELVFDMDEAGVRVFISCDDEAISAFQTQVQRALLHLLPISDMPN